MSLHSNQINLLVRCYYRKPTTDLGAARLFNLLWYNALRYYIVAIALVSRQFVEMTRSRVEGLLAAFPKLMGSSKQHTFVETESVRYVYQPLERLYMLLITTKASNILEDLETLRLFSRVVSVARVSRCVLVVVKVPEYCRSLDENDVMEHSFELIFAFDEIVALGYRENVNLAQIRTFTEMDSHDEKVHNAMRLVSIM